MEFGKNDTTRTSESAITARDHVANKGKSFAQTQTSTRKIDQEEKTLILPPTRPIKCPIKKSLSKTRSKDKRSPIQTPASKDTSPNKKYLKTNKTQYQKKKYKNQEI